MNERLHSMNDGYPDMNERLHNTKQQTCWFKLIELIEILEGMTVSLNQNCIKVL
jgi:hypothetical protein